MLEAASAVKCANALHVMKTVVTKLAAMSSQQGKKHALVRVAVNENAVVQDCCQRFLTFASGIS